MYSSYLWFLKRAIIVIFKRMQRTAQPHHVSSHLRLRTLHCIFLYFISSFHQLAIFTTLAQQTLLWSSCFPSTTPYKSSFYNSFSTLIPFLMFLILHQPFLQSSFYAIAFSCLSSVTAIQYHTFNMYFEKAASRCSLKHDDSISKFVKIQKNINRARQICSTGHPKMLNELCGEAWKKRRTTWTTAETSLLFAHPAW